MLINARAKERVYRAPCLNLLQLLMAVTRYQGQASEPTTPGKDPKICLDAGANTALQIPIWLALTQPKSLLPSQLQIYTAFLAPCAHVLPQTWLCFGGG